MPGRPDAGPPDSARRDPILVVGLGPLARGVIDRLLAAGAAVTVLAAGSEAATWEPEMARPGVRVVTGAATAPAALELAGLDRASALVLTGGDDAENVDAALTARRLCPDLPLVVRIFDDQLREYIRRTIDSVTVLSVSAIAAPVFAEAALGAMAAVAALPSERTPAERRLRSWAMDRIVASVAIVSVLLVASATAYFRHALQLGWLDALYFVWTTVLTVGYGDITPLRASAGAKLAAMALMLAGAALVAVLYALLTGWVVGRRLAVLRGHVPIRRRGHVIIAGAGHVGVRVAERLLAHRPVVIERDADGPHIERLRARSCHVIVDDASAIPTLERAGIDRAAAVLALTDSDATNLRIALTSRARRPGLPVIARLASLDLSAHVTERGDAVALSSVALASAEFARAALQAAGLHRSQAQPHQAG